MREKPTVTVSATTNHTHAMSLPPLPHSGFLGMWPAGDPLGCRCGEETLAKPPQPCSHREPRGKAQLWSGRFFLGAGSSSSVRESSQDKGHQACWTLGGALGICHTEPLKRGIVQDSGALWAAAWRWHLLCLLSRQPVLPEVSTAAFLGVTVTLPKDQPAAAGDRWEATAVYKTAGLSSYQE